MKVKVKITSMSANERRSDFGADILSGELVGSSEKDDSETKTKTLVG